MTTKKETEQTPTPGRVVRTKLVPNHTVAGLPSDLHQALVSTSQLHRQHASAYHEVSKALDKHEGGAYEMPPELLAHLKEVKTHLQPAADFDASVRALLEKFS